MSADSPPIPDARYWEDTSFSAAEGYLRGLGRLNPGPAGETYRYSNMNYILLGAVIEAAGGRTYDEHIGSRILEPLGMGTSFTFREKARAFGLAAGHRYWFRPWHFESPLSVLILHVPDSGWMIVLSGLFALFWGFLRAALACRILKL